MGLITLTPYVANNDVLAEGQNSNEGIIATEINGRLDNANISPSAAIVGSKLADAPSGITTGKINDLQITTPKIADLNVNDAKLAALAVIAGKVKTATFSFTPAGVIAAGSQQGIDTGFGAGIVPLGVYAEGTTTNLQTSGTMFLVPHLAWNTTTSRWYIFVHNTSSSGLNAANITLKLLYIPTA